MTFTATLRRVLRRTELNVAIAGAMVGSVASMQKLFPVIEHYEKLTLRFYDGGYLWWEATANEPLRGPWNQFLKWYHGRDSECFVMQHRDGADMVRRCDIRRYEIRRGERAKS